MANSKIVFGDRVLMDLTADTVEESTLLKGVTAHDKSGEPITGTCTYDSDTTDATVAVAEMLVGKTAYARGAKLTGTMPNKGAVKAEIIAVDDVYKVPQGYHDGSGTVKLNDMEKAKLVPENIREGVTILNVVGTMSGSEGVKAQNKSVTPKTTSQTVLPDTGYTHLAQVTVAAIPYEESDNAAGGKTITIG